MIKDKIQKGEVVDVIGGIMKLINEGRLQMRTFHLEMLTEPWESIPCHENDHSENASQVFLPEIAT